MGKHTTTTTTSTIPPTQMEQDEIQGFSYNALRILGANYLAKKWLPKKGPYFIALILAMRAYVYFDYETGVQKSKCFPEAATIAERAGMSRTKVFRLLKDPDMALFVRRIARRRWDKELQREVVTSNLYMVAMDDPPTPEDRYLVAEEQERIAAIQRGDTIVEGRPPRGKPSEYLTDTLIAVPVGHSDSSVSGTLYNRNLATHTDEGLRRSAQGETTSGVAASAIGKADEPGRGRDTTNQDEARNREHGQPTPKSKSLEPHKSAGGAAGVAAAAVLSEAETWKAQARAALDTTRHPVTKQNDLEHQLAEFGTEGVANAVERILSHHATYLTPVDLIPALAQIARERTSNRYAHIDASAAGYFISVMNNLATEARRAGYDLAKLRKTTAKATAKQRPPAQAAHASATQPSTYAQPQPVTRSPIIGGGVAADDVLRLSLYGRR